MTVALPPAPVPVILDRATIARMTGLRPRQLSTTHQLPEPVTPHTWHLAAIRAWAQDNGLDSAIFTGQPAMPLVIGKFGICALLGITENVYERWRREDLLPGPDMTIDSRPLWWGATIHAWAKARTLLAADALATGAAGLAVQEPVPVWGMADIAAATGLKETTVRTRLHWYYNTAIRNDVWPLPMNALPLEDLCPDGVPLRFPETIISWARWSGRMEDPEAVAAAVAHVVADPVQERVDAGLLWTKKMIAQRLDVTPKAVQRWAEGSAGRHFPYPADSLADGTPVWDPPEVERWAELEGRLKNGKPVRRKAGRRPAALDKKWEQEQPGAAEMPDWRELSAQVRDALQEMFPGVMFQLNVTVSARQHVLRLTWTDGPPLSAMTTAQRYNPVFGRFTRVLNRRHLSDGYRRKLAGTVAEMTGAQFSPGRVYKVTLDGREFAGTGKELLLTLSEC